MQSALLAGPSESQCYFLASPVLSLPKNSCVRLGPLILLTLPSEDWLSRLIPSSSRQNWATDAGSMAMGWVVNVGPVPV